MQPTEWEQKLWHWYDSTDYAGNLFNLPTVAYSGEIDKQKQAADMMAKAMKAEGLELVHLIGPGTAHKYHPETKKEVSREDRRARRQGPAGQAGPGQVHDVHVALRPRLLGDRRPAWRSTGSEPTWTPTCPAR